MQTLSRYLSPVRPLIVADLANNHSGNLELAIEMIDELGELQKKFGFKIAVKFQYRNLDTYIHKKYKGNEEIHFVKRFESTRLEWVDFLTLTNHAKKIGLLTAATPFDEFSVDKVKEHKHDLLKIASASANDWNLLEKSISQKIPMVVSVGGLDDFQIEKVVTFLKHRNADFALMHCVALYPTKDSDLNLSRIAFIQNRYKVITGYSTHESPNNYFAGPLALAAGAQILEKHFAKSAPGISVNQYSGGRSEFQFWLESLDNACSQLFDKEFSHNLTFQKNTLRQLQRGLYASRDIEVGELIDLTNTYAAIPVQDTQFITNEISMWQNFVCQDKISKDEPINKTKVSVENNRGPIETILSDTRTLVVHSGITINRETDIEISHHYGLDKFNSFGAVLITLLNREYAKKLVIMKKDQTHPEHFHKLKEETFVVIIGRLEVQLDGIKNTLHPGDVLVIPRESLHSMIALDDCVFEEISSTNYADDSFYSDSEGLLQNRKTAISLWF